MIEKTKKTINGRNKETLIERDLAHIWHPYTQMKDCETMPPIAIEKARGMKLYAEDGRVFYDTISSWWCNIHGHGHPVIRKAIKSQTDRLEHVLFAGFTHKPAVELAERLIDIVPKGLSKVFYSDNGSTAVEVALKMSIQYWQGAGKKEKRHFISFDMGYHGDTVGTMSVSGVDLYNKRFEGLFFKTFKAPTPYCYRCPCGMTKEKCSLECFSRMEELVKARAHETAAVIVEPLLLGAGGMIIYPAEYLRRLRALTEKYDVHLIADEVATGFGRTGKMFACEHAGITPDFLCLSKGITSGYLPLAATLTTRKVFDAFYGDYADFKTFFHGHTYTANPIACAAAVASLGLFESERTLDNARRINTKLKGFLRKMSRLEIVGDTRSIGVVGAMELVKDRATKEAFGPKRRIGLEIYKRGLEKGLLLRPLGEIIYFFLPLSVTARELDDIFFKTEGVMGEISCKL